jgi:hypothetical protein
MTRVDATRRLAVSGTFAYTVAKPVGGDDVDDTSAELAAFDTLKQKLDDESALKTDLNANLAIDGNQASVTAAPAPTVKVSVEVSIVAAVEVADNGESGAAVDSGETNAVFDAIGAVIDAKVADLTSGTTLTDALVESGFDGITAEVNVETILTNAPPSPPPLSPPSPPTQPPPPPSPSPPPMCATECGIYSDGADKWKVRPAPPPPPRTHLPSSRPLVLPHRPPARPASSTGRLSLPPQRARVPGGQAGLPVPPSDNGPGAVLQLRLLAVPDAREEDADGSRVQGEARVRAQDRHVREEGAEEAVEAAQVPEEVGDGRRRRVHEPQDAAQVPDVVRRLRLTGRNGSNSPNNAGM